MRKQRRKRRGSPSAGDGLCPPPERYLHDDVERFPAPISDSDGRTGRPWRSIDILAAMERRGAISAEMRGAGDDFRTQFRSACLDPLKAAPFERLSPSRGEPGFGAMAARQRIYHALEALGGLRSPSGSCVWNVLGWEKPLRLWSIEQTWRAKPVAAEEASGILIGALGVLQAHYEGRRPGRHNGSNARLGL